MPMARTVFHSSNRCSRWVDTSLGWSRPGPIWWELRQLISKMDGEERLAARVRRRCSLYAFWRRSMALNMHALGGIPPRLR